MSYPDFKNELLTQIRREFSPDYDIRISSILKTNAVTLDSLMIYAPGCNLTPNIYLNYYYERYEKGLPFDAIFKEILDCYQNAGQTLPSMSSALRILLIFGIIWSFVF